MRDSAGHSSTYGLDPAGNRMTRTVTTDTQAPNAPVLSVAAFSSSQINLSWTVPFDNVGVTSYQVYRTGVASAIATVTAPTVTFSDTGLSPSTAYSYTVKALDAQGNSSSASNTAGTTTQPPPVPGTLQFSAATYSVAESGTSLTVTVTRTGGSDGAASVSYATSNGTATAGSDYTAASGTLNWTAGSAANKTFSIPITNDAAIEGSEQFTVALSGATGAPIGSVPSATVTITEPPVGTLQLSASTYSVAENGGSVTIAATRTGGSYGAVSVNYATGNGSAVAGSDFTSASGTLNWANGDAANKTFAVSITNDSAYEGAVGETFTVSLNTPSGSALGSPPSATVTINEDDSPPVTPPGAPTWTGRAATCISPTTCTSTGTETLKWTPGSGSTPLNYEVQRRLGSTWSNEASPTSTTLLVATPLNRTVSFQVRACNSAGCGSYSSIINFFNDPNP